MIIIGIFNHPDRRTIDLTPTVGEGDNGGWGPGGGLEGYYKFIAERLKPYIDTNFRTKTGPQYTGIAGSSFGGLAAFIMAYEHPETFGLAGCMSTSFWWDNEVELKAIEKGTGPKKDIKIWLDAGLNEYEMWTPTERAYAILEAKGWRLGDDLACYLDYNGSHDDASWNGRTRSMLYFLLHKKQLEFEGYRLVPIWDPSQQVLQLNQGHPPIIGPEVMYTNGLRLTNATPALTPKDRQVASTNGDDPLVVHIAGPGETNITSTFDSITASIKVVSYGSRHLPGTYECQEADWSRPIDADFSDSSSLPLAIKFGSIPVAYFGTTYDNKNVYIVIHVFNHSIIASEHVKPWRQDGVSIQFDARSEPALREGDQGWSAPDYLLVELSPGTLGSPIALSTNIDKLAKVLQTEIKIQCAIEPGGYNVEVSVPVSYLDQQQRGIGTSSV